MMSIRVTFILLLLTVLISCSNKEAGGDYNFRGIVIDYSTGEGISGASIYLHRADGASPGGNLNNPVTHTGMSTNGGGYNIGVDWISGKMIYKVEASKSGYRPALPQCGNSYFGKFLQASVNTYRDTLYLDKETIVRIVTNNVAPAHPNDTLDVRLVREAVCTPFPTNIYNAVQRQYIGAVTNQVMADSFSLRSTPTLKLSWTVRNNGIISTQEQTVTATEFSTTTFNIDY